MNVRLQSSKAKEFRLSTEVCLIRIYACSFISLFMTVPCFSFCREVLELSRDFKSLLTGCSANEASQDSSALEDLRPQQFSLGSWISSATTPRTSSVI